MEAQHYDPLGTPLLVLSTVPVYGHARQAYIPRCAAVPTHIQHTDPTTGAITPCPCLSVPLNPPLLGIVKEPLLHLV